MNRLPVDWRAPTQPIFDQAPTQPFRLVAPLEQRLEALEAENAAFRDDQQSLCDLLADKCGQIARLEQELAQLKKHQNRGAVVDHFGAMRVRP